MLTARVPLKEVRVVSTPITGNYVESGLVGNLRGRNTHMFKWLLHLFVTPATRIQVRRSSTDLDLSHLWVELKKSAREAKESSQYPGHCGMGEDYNPDACFPKKDGLFPQLSDLPDDYKT